MKLNFKAGLFQALLQIDAVFVGEGWRLPTRKTLYRQAAQLHQLAEDAATVRAEIFSHDLHQAG